MYVWKEINGAEVRFYRTSVRLEGRPLWASVDRRVAFESAGSPRIIGGVTEEGLPYLGSPSELVSPSSHEGLMVSWAVVQVIREQLLEPLKRLLKS